MSTPSPGRASNLRLVRAALALLAVAGAHAARAEAPPIAFLALRPAADRALAATAIAHLPEAQRLRLAAESVVEALSGSSVMGHEALRSALGRAYLVDVFACSGDPACLLRAAEPLRRRGVTTALAADYAADGAVLLVRVRRLDLVSERLAGEVAFDVPREEADAIAPWRAALAALFADAGSLRLVVSQGDARCLLDGRPCEPGPEGVMSGVPEGEHLLVVTKEGFQRAERVVAVRRGEETRVALALVELPVQAQKPPDPTDRLPTFEPPGETLEIRPFGSLRVLFLLDDASAGEREDPVVPSAAGAGAALVVLPRPAVLGLTVQAPRQESGWQVRGALSLGWVKDAGPEIDSAYAEVLHEERGLRVMLGWGQGIVSSLTAGTLTLPEGFGDLALGCVGVTASEAFGPLLVEGFVGKHKSHFSPQPEVDATSPAPMGALHLAYVDRERSGTLYGDAYPLTLGVSGLLGQEQVGRGDEPGWAEAQGIAAPRREPVGVWVASLEAYVPFGPRLSLAGEAWVGQDVALLEGAQWQPPRVDPATGDHRPLRSAGGWAQLAYAPREDLELRLVAGTDRALSDAAWGRPIGDAEAIESNSLAAAAGVWRWGPLAFGLQLHLVRTVFAATGAARTLHGAAFSTQLKF